LILLDLGKIECRISFSTARWKILWRWSMARMKSMEEIGSPYLRLRTCLIGRPEIPFKRILEDEEERAKLIQSLHLVLKPSFSNTSNRYAYETESKDFAMSSLRKRVGTFFLCNSLMIL
jgi:hypothetical protein